MGKIMDMLGYFKASRIVAYMKNNAVDPGCAKSKLEQQIGSSGIVDD